MDIKEFLLIQDLKKQYLEQYKNSIQRGSYDYYLYHDQNNEAAFYGGTCLRIFHGLQRFSENLDFSLLAPNDNFEFTQYFQPIVDIFAMVGREVEIKKKDKKKNFGKVESAFLKDNTDVYLC